MRIHQHSILLPLTPIFGTVWPPAFSAQKDGTECWRWVQNPSELRAVIKSHLVQLLDTEFLAAIICDLPPLELGVRLRFPKPYQGQVQETYSALVAREEKTGTLLGCGVRYDYKPLLQPIVRPVAYY